MSDWLELFNGRDLTGWRGRSEPHTWSVVGGVRLAPDTPEAFEAEPGTGVLLNSERGRTVDLHSDLVQRSASSFPMVAQCPTRD